MTITISPRVVTKTLLCVVAVLSVVSSGGKIVKYALGHDSVMGLMPIVLRLFDTDMEANVPTWYSSATLLICSGLLCIIAIAKQTARARFRKHWMALAIIFLFLSMDETARIHEMTIEPLRSVLHASGFLHHTWVVLGAVSVLIFALAYVRFLGDLPGETRRLFVIAGTIYVGGALGMEMLGSTYLTPSGYFSSMTYVTISEVEEFLEMVGVVVFIYALLRYMGNHCGTVDLRVRD